MPDLLPVDTSKWQATEETLRALFSSFGFDEIRTPFLEPTELFARSVGESTDIVEKEMYTFVDKNGESITLRPEGTASVVRAFTQHNLAHASPVSRFFYMGPMFRHERPQKGRLRQFHQVGAELLGSAHPLCDVEVMKLLHEVALEFQVENPVLEINSVGDSECRGPYREKLIGFLRGQRQRLCETCQKRTETNPMRVFDCKNPVCQTVLSDAPMIVDHLCPSCDGHFSSVRRALESSDVPFTVNKKIVRGLDYYTKTAFEMVAGGLGSQNTVGAGGRYDDLVASFGGPATPAVGFAIGMERLLLSSRKIVDTAPIRIDVIPLSPVLEQDAFILASGLRTGLRSKAAVSVTALLGFASLKSALRQSNRTQSTFALLLGEDEKAKGTVMLKNLANHTQRECPREELANLILGEIHAPSN